VVYENVLMALFLIIEPDEDIRRLYAAVVRGLGHEAEFFNGSPAADPHVVLVEPSHRESFDAVVQLRRDRPHLPVVCASIHKAAEDMSDVLQATTHLLKPFSLVELTDALQLALSQSDPLSQ
jgi:CheY-like chemotaxis protein